MVKKTKDAKSSKRRTQVKNLSKSGKTLPTAEARKVKAVGMYSKTFSTGEAGARGR